MLEKPIRIGKMDVKNRIVKAAVVENMAADDGRVTDAMMRLYEKAACGGAGLIITGGAYVESRGRNTRFQTGADRDDLIPGLTGLAHAGRQNDARIILQISHGGRQCPPEFAGDVIGPSAVKDQLTKITPRAMREDEIEEIIEAFGRAAGRAREAGFDGIEIMAGHGYLISEFLSRRTNRRQDQWGGSLENRARFYFRIIEQIRKTVGRDYPVLTKINTEDQMKAGFKLAECAWVAKRLPELGVSAVKFSGGTYESGLNITRGDLPIDDLLVDQHGLRRIQLKMILKLMRRKFRFSEAYFLPNLKKISPQLGIPVILVGGLRTPGVMEDILQQGHADMLALGRPLVRQPHWPNRILAGDERPAGCLNCNRCFIAAAKNQPVRCYASGESQAG